MAASHADARRRTRAAIEDLRSDISVLCTSILEEFENGGDNDSAKRGNNGYFCPSSLYVSTKIRSNESFSPVHFLREAEHALEKRRRQRARAAKQRAEQSKVKRWAVASIPKSFTPESDSIAVAPFNEEFDDFEASNIASCDENEEDEDAAVLREFLTFSSLDLDSMIGLVKILKSYSDRATASLAKKTLSMVDVKSAKKRYQEAFSSFIPGEVFKSIVYDFLVEAMNKRENDQDDSLSASIGATMVGDDDDDMLFGKSMSIDGADELAERTLSRFADERKRVDFKHFVMKLNDVAPNTVNEKIRVHFELFDADGDGSISIRELGAILHNGNPEVLLLIDFAETFIDRLDEDGDGTVTWDEFRVAVQRDPAILDSFMKSLPESLSMTFTSRQDLRILLSRCSMTWRKLNEVWEKLKSNSVSVGGDASSATQGGSAGADEWSGSSFEVHVTTDAFTASMFSFLSPPDPQDGPLLRRVFDAFSNNINGKQVLKCRELVSSLGSLLQTSNFTIGDVEDKAEFYFSMYNVDDDHELSREEIYRMFYASHGDVGRQILLVNKQLEEIDINGDGDISYEEYLEAAKTDSRLVEYFAG